MNAARRLVIACSCYVLLTACVVPNAWAITCGDELTGPHNVLTADLDCSSFGVGMAIRLEGRATLDLAGFTLTGSSSGGVYCTGNCTIKSSGSEGTITGTGFRGVYGDIPGSNPNTPTVELEDLLITGFTGSETVEADNIVAKRVRIVGNTGDGVEADNIRMKDSVVSDNGGTGIVVGGCCGLWRLGLDNVAVLNNGAGVRGSRLRAKIRDCEVSDNGGTGLSMSSSRISIVNGIFHRNAAGIRAEDFGGKRRAKLKVKVGEFSDGLYAVEGPRTLKLSSVTISGMTDLTQAAITGDEKITLADTTITNSAGDAVSGDVVKLKQSSISGSGKAGVRYTFSGASVRLLDSSISTSSQDAVACATESCADIVVAAEHLVRLNGSSSCETSLDTSTGLSLGICSLD